MPRQVGSVLPGSLVAWLKAAHVGDVYWTQHPMNGLITQAKRAGRTVALKRWYAVNDACEAVALVRIEVTA